MRTLSLLALLSCRGWHEPLAFNECQPYALQCACPYEEDLAREPETIERSWRCQSGEDLFDAIQRRSPDDTADDTHFYSAEDGLRAASVRQHDVTVEACGRELEQEWWGAILDCAPLCEHDETLPRAELERCAP